MPRNAVKKRAAAAASLLKHLIAVVIFVVAAGCSGGGCSSGCSSCTSITPLAGGFDATKRIENAGSVRVTKSGLSFLQAHLGALATGLLGTTSTGGVITFDIPKTSVSVGVTATICPNAPNPTSNPKICVAEIDIGKANLTITPAPPYDLHVTGTVPIRVEDIQVDVPLVICDPTIDIEVNGGGTCGGTAFDAFPLAVDVVVHVDQNTGHVARFGYTALSVPQVIDSTAANANLNANLAICNDPNAGLCGSAVAGILGLLKSTVVGQLTTQLTTVIGTQIDNQLCQKAAAGAPCPTGTTADAGMICRYNNDPANACASILLGTDGHANLGTLVQSISAGTQGNLDFLFAAGGADKNTADPSMKLSWGDLDPVNNGASVGLFGGAEANPLSKCVKLSNLAIPTGIPIPDELLGAADTLPDWPAGVPGPDVAIAVNERFANYALNGLYNSGFLCIGISTETIPLLSSGTIGILAPSLKLLGLQEEPQQVAIVIRPSSPPTVTFGNGTNLTTDPLLLVGLKQASLDFYVFSLDRFIRFMTATYDLSVPVNLTSSSAGLTPVLDTIGVSNGTVTNSQLLAESPADLATKLGGLLGSLVGQQLSGSLTAINLNGLLSSLGLNLYIPSTVAGKGSPGLRKLSKGSDNYLGIFAAFELPGMMVGPKTPPHPHTHTEVQVTRKVVDPAGLKLVTLRDDNVPVVDLVAESNLDDGTRAVEYQYKVDEGFWHPFAPSRFITLRDPWLRVQGRHVIYVRSRAVGDPESLDETPAQAEVVIDAEPPRVTISPIEGRAVTVTVRDRVAPDALVRYQLDGGAWSDWTLASHLGPVVVGDAASIHVEAQDSEGNLGTAAQPLIRGVLDGPATACNCVMAGDQRGYAGHAILLLGIALAGFSARRVRRRETGSRPEPPAPKPSAPKKAALARTLCSLAAIAVASTWVGCSCGKNGQQQAGATSSGGTGGSCPTCTELQPGLIGEYTSAVVAGTDIWVAGYSEGDPENGVQYGDLVAGKWNGTSVAWNQVDGVPSTPAVDPTMYDVNGFRGGQTESGPDVGLWTSIALGGDGNPAIAYYDRTNQALKLAQFDGKRTWSTQTVDTVPNGTAGRYAKMIFLNGNFVIAYQSIAPGGTNGALISKVRVATSAGATPTASTWAFEDVATLATTPCRASFCASTEVCVSTTKVCTATVSKCSPACASGTACVGATPACVPVWDTTKLDAYPDAIGDYVTLAPDGQGGFGIAYYDRTKGNLVTALKTGGAWKNTIVDGESAPVPTGDAGIGASLFIDASGDWHIAYVNGFSEALQYVRITKGATALAPEIIDDGLSVAGVPFADGQHLVGDDAHVLVTAAGEVQVTYQDSTAGTLHYAVGTPGSAGHTWKVSAIQQDGFAGAFSSIVVVGGKTQLLNWWRTGATNIAGDVRIVSPP